MIPRGIGQFQKQAGQNAGHLRSNIPLDGELVELILSWHGLPVETKIMVIRHFHDL